MAGRVGDAACALPVCWTWRALACACACVLFVGHSTAHGFLVHRLEPPLGPCFPQVGRAHSLHLAGAFHERAEPAAGLAAASQARAVPQVGLGQGLGAQEMHALLRWVFAVSPPAPLPRLRARRLQQVRPVSAIPEPQRPAPRVPRLPSRLTTPPSTPSRLCAHILKRRINLACRPGEARKGGKGEGREVGWQREVGCKLRLEGG